MAYSQRKFQSTTPCTVGVNIAEESEAQCAAEEEAPGAAEEEAPSDGAVEINIQQATPDSSEQKM